jgi:hypothetical protein
MTWLEIGICVYLALGCATVWACYKDMTPEVWWAWLLVIVTWPLFWWKVARS